MYIVEEWCNVVYDISKKTKMISSTVYFLVLLRFLGDALGLFSARKRAQCHGTTLQLGGSTHSHCIATHNSLGVVGMAPSGSHW